MVRVLAHDTCLPERAEDILSAVSAVAQGDCPILAAQWGSQGVEAPLHTATSHYTPATGNDGRFLFPLFTVCARLHSVWKMVSVASLCNKDQASNA